MFSYGITDGLCGFFAFGVAMNNVHTGTRGEWFASLGKDLYLNGTPGMKHVMAGKLVRDSLA